MISSRRPPTFMPTSPWSQPGMTCPCPSANEKVAPGVSFQEASKILPLL